MLGGEVFPSTGFSVVKEHTLKMQKTKHSTTHQSQCNRRDCYLAEYFSNFQYFTEEEAWGIEVTHNVEK